MQRNGIDLPEPYASALPESRAREVADEDAPTPQALFGRALARIDLGRDDEARQDLTAALPDLGDACRVELAYLDMRQRSALMQALCSAREVADAADAPVGLVARAWHVVGHAEGKLRHTGRALEAMLTAARLYSESGDLTGKSRVNDTLGMLHAARGRLEHAVYHYALSLVDKALVGDRLGMAITLGNLGRLHLRAGRFADALDCFRRDLALAEELEDRLGQARMHEDIGRAYLGQGDYDAADRSLATCLSMAQEHGFGVMAFFAWRDLCELRIQQGDLKGAATALREAEAAHPKGGERYYDCIVGTARGALLLARGDRQAVEVLEEAVSGLIEAELPDLEIPARLLLARSLLKRKLKATAEQCLMKGLARARRLGFQRYIPPLNEALTELGMVEGVLEEENRPLSRDDQPPPGAYIVRRKVGEGGFGEVYRAFDPERGLEVALKRIHLDRIYDASRRASLIESARVELEAASRVRHPGVARVYALGTEEDGGIYVTQEFVEGVLLRNLMEGESQPNPTPVLAKLASIAHALSALHAAGVVHRDLKPENVIVRPDGTPVLVDFGIAHLVKPKIAAEDDFVAGTLEYMAPEQMEGRKVDGRADLYALGVILFEWLTGLRPLDPRGRTFKEEVRFLAKEPPPRLSEFRPDLVGVVEDLVASLLEKKPRRRPAQAAEVATTMEGLSEAFAALE